MMQLEVGLKTQSFPQLGSLQSQSAVSCFLTISCFTADQTTYLVATVSCGFQTLSGSMQISEFPSNLLGSQQANSLFQSLQNCKKVYLVYTCCMPVCLSLLDQTPFVTFIPFVHILVTGGLDLTMTRIYQPPKEKPSNPLQGCSLEIFQGRARDNQEQMAYLEASNQYGTVCFRMSCFSYFLLMEK